jgi:hypothetical protein
MFDYALYYFILSGALPIELQKVHIIIVPLINHLKCIQNVSDYKRQVMFDYRLYFWSFVRQFAKSTIFGDPLITSFEMYLQCQCPIRINIKINQLVS